MCVARRLRLPEWGLGSEESVMITPHGHTFPEPSVLVPSIHCNNLQVGGAGQIEPCWGTAGQIEACWGMASMSACILILMSVT